MSTDQVQMYHISKAEEPIDKDNVVLRALVGDPNRHKPLANHPPPTTTDAQQLMPASMYTLETRYQPIPPKVLPNQKQTTLYHIQPENAQEESASTPTPTPPVPREEVEPTVPVGKETPPIVFLEQKIIPQPILYCIVGSKNTPVVNEQPNSVDSNMVSPIFHTVIGHPRRLAKDTNVDVQPAVIDRRPIFYSIVSNPRLNVIFEEPVKQVSQLPKQSSTTVEPVRHQPVPTLYSIVGGPTFTPQISEAQSPDLVPVMQSENTDFVRPVPILYTVVGDSQPPTNISREYRQPLTPIKQQNHQTAMYAVIGGPTKPQSMPLPSKTVPAQVKQEEKSPTRQPVLYPIVGKHTSLSDEDLLKSPIRQKSSQPAIVPTQRVSRSLERQMPPDEETELASRIPRRKQKPLPKKRDPTIPRSKTILVPFPDNQRTSRPKYVRNPPPWKTDYELSNKRRFQSPRHEPVQLSDYISPYAYHPARGYREETIHPSSLPIIVSPRRQKQPYENENSPNRTRRYNLWTPHSLERYHGKSKRQPRLWDFEYQTQTDGENDDDDGNEMNTNRSKQQTRRYRPRTPWIPVW